MIGDVKTGEPMTTYPTNKLNTSRLLKIINETVCATHFWPLKRSLCIGNAQSAVTFMASMATVVNCQNAPRRLFKYLTLILLSVTASLTAAAPLINGVAIHEQLGQESFIAALLTTTLSKDARDTLISREEKQMQVRILTENLSARRFKRLWIEGIAINASPEELETQSKNMAKFSNMLSITLKRGDIVVINRSRDEVKVIINGALLGTLTDTRFFDLLLRTWIGPVPLSSDFREALLVGGNVNDKLLSRFNQTKPSDARIAAISKAIVERQSNQENQIDDDSAAKPVIAAIPKPVIDAPDITLKPVIAAPKINIAGNAGNSTGNAGAATQAANANQTAAPQKIQNDQPKLAKTAATPAPSLRATAGTLAKADNTAAAGGDDAIFDDSEEEFTAESLLIQQLYIARLKKWTYKQLRYPPSALSRNQEGVVRLEVSISRDGSVNIVDVIEEAKYSMLTKAALKAVEKSDPFPAMPPEVKGEVFDFTIPIVFRIVES